MYWAAAQLQPRREALAAHCLALAGFTVYTPRLREHRVLRGRRVEVNPPLSMPSSRSRCNGMRRGGPPVSST